MIYKVTASSLNVRTAPSANGTRKGHFVKDTLVRFVEQKGTWFYVESYKTEHINLKGWVSSGYLQEVQDEHPRDTMLYTAQPDNKLYPPDQCPSWLYHMRQAIGVKEIPGSKSHPWISKAYASVNISYRFNDDEVAWCSAAVNYAITLSGCTGTNSLRANSWMDYGIPCGFILGAIMVFRSGQSEHVTLLNDVTPKQTKSGLRMECAGGNQGNQVKPSNYLLSDLLAIRHPKGVLT